jgi:hypothetical protein
MRGVDIQTYAESFEKLVIAHTFSAISTYITCFCKPTGKEDFTHGLLSQWRGYGPDGGYALQFSRKKLQAARKRAQQAGVEYDLRDISYNTQNTLKEKLLSASPEFVGAYLSHLDQLAKPLDSILKTFRSPVAALSTDALVDLVSYLVHTKSKHFAEERECRLSLIQSGAAASQSRPVSFFNRAGLLVPYITTPNQSFNMLDCVDWIVIGPAPRMGARFEATCQLVSKYGKGILVRPSHIPYTRL